MPLEFGTATLVAVHAMHASRASRVILLQIIQEN